MTKSRFYRHYKNKPYKYLGTVRHSETLEELVLYETLYENEQSRVWVRPKEMFFEKIVKDGKEIFRFEPVSFAYVESLVIGSEEKEIILGLGQKSFPDFDEVKLSRKLNETLQPYLIVAYDINKPVGFKLGFKHDTDSFNSWLGGVLPEYQQLGIGSELMMKQHDWIKTKGYKKVFTKSKSKFRHMIDLDLKHGFEIVGTEKEITGEIKILFQKSFDI